MKIYTVKVKHFNFKKPAISVYDILAETADKAKAIVHNNLVLHHLMHIRIQKSMEPVKALF